MTDAGPQAVHTRSPLHTTRHVSFITQRSVAPGNRPSVLQKFCLFRLVLSPLRWWSQLLSLLPSKEQGAFKVEQIRGKGWRALDFAVMVVLAAAAA